MGLNIPTGMICPNCNVQMVRRKSKFGENYWWGCPNYPKCTVTAAEHPDGTPMSLPADQETKDLRKEAHRLSEKMWGAWNSPRCKKQEMYSWLENNTVEGHIGKMSKESLHALIKKLNLFLEYKDV